MTDKPASPVLNAGKAISEPAVFVTGTDTGVGKTVVSAVLAVAAAARGAQAGYLKPIQTGVIDRADDSSFGHPIEGLEGSYSQSSDAAFVAAAAKSAGVYVETRTTFSFPLPAAPSVAARQVGKNVELSEVFKDFEELQQRCDFVVVEGAGGLLVPLADGFTMADLACELGLACLVVARPGLGTLNHTLLTVEAALRRGVSVVGIAFSRVPSKPNIVERTNLELVPKLTGLETLLVVPEDPGLDVDSPRVGSVVELARQMPKGFSSPKNA